MDGMMLAEPQAAGRRGPCPAPAPVPAAERAGSGILPTTSAGPPGETLVPEGALYDRIA